MSTAVQSYKLMQLCRWALRCAFRRYAQLAAVLVVMLLKIGLDLLKPWPLVFLVDYVLREKTMPGPLTRFVEMLPGPHSQFALISWSIAATLVLFLLTWAVGLASAYANIGLSQRMVYDLAADLFGKLQQLSLRFHASKSVGDNLRRVTSDATCISTIVKDAFLPVLSASISLIAMFVIMWRIDPSLTLLAFAAAPCMMLIFVLYAKPMMEKGYLAQEIEARGYSLIERTLTAMPAVQAFSREEENDRQFAHITGQTISATLSLTNVQLQFKILIGLTTTLGTAAIFWIGAHHAFDGNLGVGTILLFLSYLGSLYTPLESIMYTGSTIQGVAGSARRVLEILEAKRDITDRAGAIALARARGHIRFEHVTFGYEAARPVLQNISLAVEPGETVAFVGPTGAGKSTLLSLIPRVIDPQQGWVLLDGYDLRDIQIKTLRQNIGLVLQETFLFPISIAENIAYARPTASRKEIESVARAANAHEFIKNLPQGYDTIIGVRGATLSGGERQRLAIARALLKDAPILILDEPTSALDSETEHLILEALTRLTAGRTTFIIAHRLSTIRRAHRIVTLKEGQIQEIGTHAELMSRPGLYANLHRLQTHHTEAIAGGKI